MKTFNPIKNRYEFMALVAAHMCNPNGDPDMDNRPRRIPEVGLGVISDVAQKRDIRDYIQTAFPEQDILMRSGASVNREIAGAMMDVIEKNSLKGVKAGEKAKETSQRLCEKYWDVRAFGGVMSTGRNGGQIQGPVQIDMAVSYDPIEVEDITITRMCYTSGDYDTLQEFDDADAKMDENKKRTMGNKSFTPFGLYLIKGTVSASLAEKTGFSENDLDMLWESILQMYEHSSSSSKAGMSLVSPLIIFKHVGKAQKDNEKQQERQAKLGCAPAHLLYRLLSVKKKDSIECPMKVEDYDISFNASDIPDGVTVGFKYLPFDDVEWGTMNLEKYGINVK